jgi:hypothetical protein
MLLGAGAYYATIGFAEAKWVRYLLPLVPYLCLLATAAMVWLTNKTVMPSEPSPAVHRLSSTSVLRPSSFFRYSAPTLLLGSAFLGALAVLPIYRTEHTQIEASKWVYGNVPQGSRIGIETTAIPMPLEMPGSPRPEEHYAISRFDPVADRPGAEVSAQLYAHLSEAGYLVLDTTQAARTVPRLPWRYPVQIRYYDLLFSGQLGFTLAHRAVSYPRIGPLEIPDDGGWVDVSYMDSSHPPIYIFKKERALPRAEWDALFAEAASQPSTPSRRAP